MAAKRTPSANHPHCGRSQSSTKRHESPLEVSAIVVLAGFRIEQAVGMKDEVAHVGVVDRALCRALPGIKGGLVVRIGADKIDLRQVLELDGSKIFQLASDDEMKELFLVRLT